MRRTGVPWYGLPYSLRGRVSAGEPQRLPIREALATW
jgi:hypothetical protein